MPDWRGVVRHRLIEIGVDPTADASLTDELALHLDDRYRTSLTQGSSAEEAHAAALRELDGCEQFASD